MICKQRDKREHPERDKFSRAGAKAEEQMAFYFERAFGDSNDIRVFNDLRFVDEKDDAIQVDHLLLHPRCIILIESKSVTSEVRVNKHKEWIRVWHGQQMGMPSPILQTQRQADKLKKILNAYCESLRGKMLGALQKRFNATPFEVIVAISDTGIIKRDVELPEVCKADQVVERATEIIQRHKKAAGLLSLSMKDGLEHLTHDEVEKITQFFLTYHLPLKSETTPKTTQPEEAEADVVQPKETLPPVPPKPSLSPQVHHAASAASPPARLGICEKCGTQCEILWGKYGYYWKCTVCGANMPIKEYCPACRGKMKLRKAKRRFFKYCQPCKTPELLYYETK